MRRLSLNRSRSRPKSGQNIPKNRGRTTIPERMVETLPGLPFIGDQVVCLSHDQAARSGPASMTPVGFRPRKPDALVRRGVGAAERPRVMGTVASATSDPGRPGRFPDVSEIPGFSAAVPKVRVHLPPAGSPLRTRSVTSRPWCGASKPNWSARAP